MTNHPSDELLVEETELTDDDEPQNVRYDIMSFPTDFTVQVMFQKWSSGQLIIPKYQRRYVWNMPQASRLIESFLLGLPIPQVFLYREHSGPELYVVDGHQRLATIAHYYRGAFPGDRIFRLRGVNPNWDGKTYTDLSEDDQKNLNDATLRSIIIRQIQPEDNSSVYQIFERLNTGGTQLNPMEIRRAIFRGKANDLLDKLNQNTNWRELIGRTEPDPRFRDLEMILRVLALTENWRNYSKPMKSFITQHMAVLDKLSSEDICEIEERFSNACKLIRNALETRPFHLRQRLNLAVMDVIMACSIELIDSLDTDIGIAFEQLREDDAFIDSVSYNTSDVSSVQQRFNLTHNAFAS